MHLKRREIKVQVHTVQKKGKTLTKRPNEGMKKLNGVTSCRLEVWSVLKEPSDEMVIGDTRLMRSTSSGTPAFTILDTLTRLYNYSSGVLQRLWSSNKAQLCCGCWENLKAAPHFAPSFMNKRDWLTPVCDCWPAASPGHHHAAKTQNWWKCSRPTLFPLKSSVESGCDFPSKEAFVLELLDLISRRDFLFAVLLECVAAEVSFGLTRPWLPMLQQTASQNVTLITALMHFTLLWST